MSLSVYLHRVAKCPHCGGNVSTGEEVFWQNITHNLVEMAKAAGVYGIVWRPEENGITTAGQMIEPLRLAIADMKAKPSYYEQFNSSNGWGLYEHFLPWLIRYMEACVDNPEAQVSAHR